MNTTPVLYFDHIAIPIDSHENLEDYIRIFELLGFKKEWYRGRIGNNETAMETVVMASGHPSAIMPGAKFALMKGIDGAHANGEKIVSQVNAYYRRFGFFPQHIALRCDDIKNLVEEWSSKGIRFLTEDENQKPRILHDREENGTEILQCFTYPLNRTWFFEIKQIIRGDASHGIFEEFTDANVQGLWHSLDRALAKGWLFSINIFGELRAPNSSY